MYQQKGRGDNCTQEITRVTLLYIASCLPFLCLARRPRVYSQVPIYLRLLIPDSITVSDTQSPLLWTEQYSQFSIMILTVQLICACFKYSKNFQFLIIFFFYLTTTINKSLYFFFKVLFRPRQTLFLCFDCSFMTAYFLLFTSIMTKQRKLNCTKANLKFHCLICNINTYIYIS